MVSSRSRNETMISAPCNSDAPFSRLQLSDYRPGLPTVDLSAMENGRLRRTEKVKAEEVTIIPAFD